MEMSDVMLLGVLRMPPNCWDNDSPIDVMQRHSRYCEAASEIEKMRDALTELRDRIVGHPAYSDLTEAEEQDIGGDTAELSYLARVANAALGHNE
jgi:hypothetical protein